MKTLKGIVDTETFVVSIVRFGDVFKVEYNASNAISIRVFSDNKAKTVYKTFLDDCDINCKDYLKNSLTFGKVDENGYINFILDTESGFSFDVTHRADYTVVIINLTRDIVKIV